MASRSLAAGILAAVITLIIVTGGISISLAEAQPQQVRQISTPTPALPSTQIVVIVPTLTSAPIMNAPTNTQFPLPSPTLTATIPPSPTVTYTNTIPPTITNTPTPALTSTLAPCAQPPGWITYVVVPGDYLSQIAYVYKISLADLRRVNCLGRSSIIQPGQKLFVPSLPTPTLTPALSGTNTPANPS
jgi:hypothetical protein